MLPATDDERQHVEEYFKGQAPDLTVTFIQKVYEEVVLSHKHAIWDVHTDKNRWWVITNPTNLYSQDQFPNMDLALTFHMGLCLRVMRGDRTPLSELKAEPFSETYRLLTEATDALAQAEEVSDFQAIGVRCREVLLAFIKMGQELVPWPEGQGTAPKAADAKDWIQHFVVTLLPGEANERRRQLYRGLLDGAWTFANWLTHNKESSWYDAEAAASSTENAVGLFTSVVLRHIKGVPDNCPACGSRHLTPERGMRSDMPDITFERSVCTKCGWTGEPAALDLLPEPDEPKEPTGPPEGECYFPGTPLRSIRKPTDNL